MLRTPSGDPLPRVLTTAQARRLGLTRAVVATQLRRSRWEQLSRGVYFTRGDPPTRGDWIRAGMLIVGRGAVLSGWDAARAHDVGTARPPVDEVLILAVEGTHRVIGQARIRPSQRDVRCSWLDVPDVGRTLVAGAARAVADAALVYRTFPPVRAMVTSAVQKQLCTAADLRAELATGPRNGSAFLRRAIEDVEGGALSIAEAELADLMRAAALPPFELNVPILDHTGQLVATADVLWRALRAILEVDSRKHHFLEPQWSGTMRRHNKLTRHMLAVTHYPPVELRHRPSEVMRELDSWLRARAAELGVGFPPPPPPRPAAPFVLPPLPHSRDQQG